MLLLCEKKQSFKSKIILISQKSVILQDFGLVGFKAYKNNNILRIRHYEIFLAAVRVSDEQE